MKRLSIQVGGIVQGVGFRPFVYRLAVAHKLAGWVLNDSLGVTVEVEGTPSSLEEFTAGLRDQAPPLAMITSLAVREVPAAGESGFTIRESRKEAPVATLISPDIAVCDDCLAEMRDPLDRRHRYPFINCTNCGPRYTIIEDIPYDRPSTSMKHFTMCAECSQEYHDPGSRRFHAQPNACPVCGPRLLLMESDGSPADSIVDPLEEARSRLLRGMIVAVKGLGGFHLVVNATDVQAVTRLRRRKMREQKAMAIMVRDSAAARRLVFMSPREEVLLASPRRPILLAAKRPGNPVAEPVAPRTDELGVMLPYTPLHHLLLEGTMPPLVMTSANLSEEPICIDNREAVHRLEGIADAFLAHDRPIHLRSDDSVVRIFRGEEYPVRRSRGYAPAPVPLGTRMRPVLGLGAELKNTVCLLKGDLAFPGQHVGDLTNQEAFSFFRMTVDHLERILECRAEVLARDLHPDYLSSRYAMEQTERPVVAVQHHHAHAVSVMAEHNIEGPVLAVTFDGTGLGNDGHVWGGEFLVADRAGFKRAAHLREVPLPGGDAAVREPWRMALSFLHALHGAACAERAPAFASRFPRESLSIITAMIDRSVNTLPTSSAGRLFDAVASLLGVCDRASFEGQAAIELEGLIGSREKARPYRFDVDNGTDGMVINTLPVIEAVLRDLDADEDPGVISARFHETMALVIGEVTAELGRHENLKRVVLTGGVFQNRHLLERAVSLLEAGGFQVFWHRKVPANDGGLSLGQAVAAHEMHFGRAG